jgi:hypothetical protein
VWPSGTPWSSSASGEATPRRAGKSSLESVANGDARGYALRPSHGIQLFVQPLTGGAPDPSRLGGKGASLVRLVCLGHRGMPAPGCWSWWPTSTSGS